MMTSEPRRRSRWWRFGSVRARTTLVATTVVVAVLVAAVAALASAVEQNLISRVLAQGEREVAAVVEQLAAGRAPDAALAATPTSDVSAVPTHVAILDHEGNPVVGAGFLEMPGVDEVSVEEIGAALGGDSSGPAPAQESQRVVRVGTTDLAIAQRSIEVDGELLLVVAASPLAEVVRSVEEIIRISTLGVPVLGLIVAGITWIATGRTLRPIESIRSEVEVLSSHTLNRRVPVPATDDEVARLAATMNRMLERLEKASVRQREFISNASHELRSPVTSVRTQLEVALAHLSSSDWPRIADGVLDETGRLERIIDDLLLLARLDEDTTTSNEKVDISRLTREVANRLDQPGVSIVFDIADELQVKGRVGQIESVIRNLVDNAARHATSRVRVAASAKDGGAVITVDDDGPGIAPPDRMRIFDRFTRLDTARSRSDGGVGLGLAVVERVVRNHNGSIEVTDSPDHGARFTVWLPGTH